jgi:chromosome partitioning protein
MAVILFTNLKGGVAKTTNSIAVAECLASSGKPTLLIDADHQCTATELLLGEDRLLELERKRRTLHDLMSEMLKPDFEPSQFPAYVQPHASNIGGGLAELSVLPCSVRIDDFQTNYAKGGNGFKTWDDFRKLLNANRLRFRRWLKQTFSYVIIDCPPSLAIQVKYLLAVSDSYIIPSQPNHLSIRGSIWLRERIQALGYRKDCLGTLWSMYRSQDPMQVQVVAGVANGTSRYVDLPKPFDAKIPLAANIANANVLDDREPKSFRAKYGAQFAPEYESLCEEIMERINADVGVPAITGHASGKMQTKPEVTASGR